MDHELSDRIEHALGTLRDELAARHGVCRLDVQASVDEPARRVVLRGEVLVDRLREVVLAKAREHLEDGWSIEAQLEVVQGGPWFDVERSLSLFDRRPQAHGQARLVTEVMPEDGPLERLGTRDQAALWRDRFGTVGWAHSAIGPPCEAPALPSPQHCDPDAFVAAARAYLDVPYRLGGTTDRGIDCSALIQRAAWSSLHIALPRNSGDLWALGTRVGEPPRERGHLVFTWTADESLRHVALTDRDALVHASLSRRRVVADPWAKFVGASQRLEWLPFEAIVALGERSAGAANLLAAGVRLGVAG